MQLLGIFGHPIGHTLSPLMQQAALNKLGIGDRFFYLPFDVQPDQLQAAVAGIRALEMRGVNVTIPYKENVLPFLDRVDQGARLLGAVNVIVNEDGILSGYNTDGSGFLRSLEEETGIEPTGQKVLILGAGGACRSVAAALCVAGADEMIIVNRNRERAQSVAKMLEPFKTKVRVMGYEADGLRTAIGSARMVVNTTSVGMYPNEGSPIAGFEDCFQPGQLVADIIYRPRVTTLLREAKKRGALTMGGLGMLLHQGAEAFKLWTGMEAPIGEMRRALEDGLK